MTAARAMNLITDVPGLRVGNAHDAQLRSGVTVVLAEKHVNAAIDVRGGGTGTRETHALEPEGMVGELHGLVLSGGSAFGLDAATGVQSFLRARNIGYAVGSARVPIVPQAILFDLLNGGDKEWGKRPPYQDLAFQACEAAGADFMLGTAGAGYGATTANLKGGLGSASARTADGATVGALVAVNAVGAVTVGDTPCLWAAPFERNGEFGGLGVPETMSDHALQDPPLKGGPPGQSTTIAVVAVDAELDRVLLKRLAIMAHTGVARAIYPAHTPLDGDLVFAVSTARGPRPRDSHVFARLGMEAANALARAVARAVYEATAYEDGPVRPPAYRDLFGGKA